jgi:hypothetical protein
MNTTTSILLTGVIVATGRWAMNQDINARIVIALIILALILSLMGQSQPGLANQFGLIVLLSATFGYGPAIFKKLGY